VLSAHPSEATLRLNGRGPWGRFVRGGRSGPAANGPIVLPAGRSNHAEALPDLLTVTGGVGHFDIGKRTLSGRPHEDTVLVSEQRGFSLDRQLRGTCPLGELTCVPFCSQPVAPLRPCIAQRNYYGEETRQCRRPLRPLCPHSIRAATSARFLPCVSMAITRYTATMTVRPMPLAEKSAHVLGRSRPRLPLE
jgi:hypothetical protein